MQVSFPTRPTDPEQCGPPASVAIRQLSQERSQRMNDSHARSREWMRQCEQRYSVTRDVVSCYKQGEQIGRQYDEYARQQEADVRSIEEARRRCEEVARENQRIIGRQKEMEAQMRQQQQQQLQQQAENDRRVQEQRNRQEYETRQREAYAAQLEAQRRQQERNQPRLIAQVPGGNYESGTRNDSRAVQTPQMQAQARIEAEQRARAEQQQVRAQEQQAMQDIARQLLASATAATVGSKAAVGTARAEGIDARRDMLERALNPNDTQNAALDETVKLATRENAAINRARGISGVESQVARDAYAGTGSAMNNAIGQLDGALAQSASLNAPAPLQTASLQASSGGQTSAAQSDAETVFWDSIKGSTDAREFRAYLSRYPAGRFRVLAENRISMLATGAGPQATPQQQAAKPSATTTDARRSWYLD